MATRQQQEQLIALTTAMFDAPPGADFLAEFESYLDQGLSIEQVAANLAATDAFNAQFSGMDNDDAKINMVLEGFGIGSESPAYQEAFNFFNESLAAGRNPGEVLLDAANFLSTTEDETFSTASATFKNKVETGITHSIELGLPSEDLAELKSVLSNVTSDPQSVTAAAQALNEKKQELEQGEVEEDEGTGGSGGGGSTGPTFTVTETAGDVTFSGTATGDISVSWAGTVNDSIATFSRGGVPATTKPDFSNTGKATKISVETGQTLAATAAQVSGVTVEGAGSVSVTALEDTLGADLSNINVSTFNVTVTGNTVLDAGANLNGAAVTIADGFDLTGTDAQIGDLTITDAGGNTTVTVTAIAADADLSNITLDGTGSALNATVTGTVALASAADLNGAAVELQANADLTGTDAQIGGLTITDAGDNTTVTVTAIAADADLSNITLDGTGSALNATVDTASTTSLNTGADLNNAAVSVEGNGTLDVTDVTTLNAASFNVAAGATLTLTTTQADALAGKITSSGTVVVEVQGGTTDLTGQNLTDADTIDLNGQNATLSIEQAGLTLSDSSATTALATRDIIIKGEFDATADYSAMAGLAVNSVTLNDDNNAATIDFADAQTLDADANTAFATDDAITVTSTDVTGTDDITTLDAAEIGGGSVTIDEVNGDNAYTLTAENYDIAFVNNGLSAAADDTITVTGVTETGAPTALAATAANDEFQFGAAFDAAVAITGFDAGVASGDVLNLSALGVNAIDGEQVLADGEIALISDVTPAASTNAADVAAWMNAPTGGGYTTASDDTISNVVAVANGDSSYSLYDVAGTADTTVGALTLIGTVNADEALVAGNFAIA